jgi:hypothetical protein
VLEGVEALAESQDHELREGNIGCGHVGRMLLQGEGYLMLIESIVHSAESSES